MLWELFSFHRPSLVLCASALRYQSVSRRNLDGQSRHDRRALGFIDAREASVAGDIEAWIDELCRGAVDTEPILHAFKNSMHLRIGIRDILGKEDLTETHHALANVAESCLRQIINVEYQKLIQRFGVPTTDAKEDAEFIVLGLGKLEGENPTTIAISM